MPSGSKPGSSLVRQQHWGSTDAALASSLTATSTTTSVSSPTTATPKDGIRSPDAVIAATNGTHTAVDGVGETRRQLSQNRLDWIATEVAAGLATALTQLISAYQAFGTVCGDYMVNSEAHSSVHGGRRHRRDGGD